MTSSSSGLSRGSSAHATKPLVKPEDDELEPAYDENIGSTP